MYEKSKTISGHYGSSYSLAHNNRNFLPHNADPSRMSNNYNLVMAGQRVPEFFPNYKDTRDLWSVYRVYNTLYWSAYQWEKEEILKRIWEEKKRHWQFQSGLDKAFDHLGILALFLLPIFVAISICEAQNSSAEIAYYEDQLSALRLESVFFRYSQGNIRDALRSHDRKTGSELLAKMDTLVTHCEFLSDRLWGEPERFATLEEVYQKVFEPGFQEFQAKQRPCRRYNGTYLDQIRERQKKAQQTCSTGSQNVHALSEAIEVVFGIGDMDDTGYVAAPTDAAKAEVLLKDFCQHLVSSGNVCTVTMRELANPHWKPPFKHGLILINLVAHFDEATPGVHATFIPYSSGCHRGPSAQPSLGRAFAGMGYPSTWKNATDPNGNPIPKKDKSGNVMHNSNGSVRIQQIPDKQGIIDWIADQKTWLQKEMYSRYGWQRTYKGSHPRGNLSTPDYKVARANERLAELEITLEHTLRHYLQQAKDLSDDLSESLDKAMAASGDIQIILDYLRKCPEDRFNQIYSEAYRSIYASQSARREEIHDALWRTIRAAQAKQNQSASSRSADSITKTPPER